MDTLKKTLADVKQTMLDALGDLVDRQMKRMEEIGVELERLGEEVDRATDEAVIQRANARADELLDEIRAMDNEVRQVELGLKRARSAA